MRQWVLSSPVANTPHKATKTRYSLLTYTFRGCQAGHCAFALMTVKTSSLCEKKTKQECDWDNFTVRVRRLTAIKYEALDQPEPPHSACKKYALSSWTQSFSSSAGTEVSLEHQHQLADHVIFASRTKRRLSARCTGMTGMNKAKPFQQGKYPKALWANRVCSVTLS